ncbi:MAG: hypothetical protein L6R38_003282 [Xanthoria sp. 2 TBL-2021]|nr:MAG: hypothetical protein L6R38_003282 [Xanthoria sp. 2 TBL-2021]
MVFNPLPKFVFLVAILVSVVSSAGSPSFLIADHDHESSLSRRNLDKPSPQQDPSADPPVPILDLSSQYILNALAASKNPPNKIGPSALAAEAAAPTGAGKCGVGSPCADGRFMISIFNRSFQADDVEQLLW